MMLCDVSLVERINHHRPLFIASYVGSANLDRGQANPQRMLHRGVCYHPSSLLSLFVITLVLAFPCCMFGRFTLVGARRMASTSSNKASGKTLYIVRHGQAVHNPRAEAAKEKGCSMDEFFRLMREDDALDADLTELGKDQARKCHQDHFVVAGVTGPNPLGIDLVVASCLSRTMDTADLVFPHVPGIPRISIDKFREVNGNLLNGKRRTKSELEERHSNWNFDSLTTQEDNSWTPEMEKYEDAAERGYQGLVELLTGETSTTGGDTILLVCHGGILRYAMNLHPLVHLADERTTNDATTKSVESRFDNCELRKYRLSWKDETSEDGSRRSILLTQLDH